ncbi:hypothetical protein GOBAR_AA23669 [Gossypium barbadense]|uniref:BZIP domain-containing protein n=2 Tax=Gossypium TaxID=3633 RepID=A0A2P5X0X7_GOSBA|nr:hypothetical protein GOBAR_AA23669 [Gossypium barbadense]
MDKTAQEKEPKTLPASSSQEPSSTTNSAGPANADWSGFQAYSPIPPHGFLASTPQAPPYMWGVQHIMPPYGTPPHPYVAMYPHGGIYAHPSIPPGSYPFSPFAMPSPNGIVEASGNTPGNMEADGKPSDVKEKLPIKRSKGSLGSLNMITGKNNNLGKESGASANGAYSRSAESGSEGTSEGSDENSHNLLFPPTLWTYDTTNKFLEMLPVFPWVFTYGSRSCPLPSVCLPAGAKAGALVPLACPIPRYFNILFLKRCSPSVAASLGTIPRMRKLSMAHFYPKFRSSHIYADSHLKSGGRLDSGEGEASQNGNSAHGPQNGGPNTMVNTGLPIVPISTAVATTAVPGPTTNLHIGMDYWGSPASSTIPAMRGKVPPTPVAGGIVTPASRDSVQSQIWLQDERELKRQRRKQSNRESARRSRLRKQAECDELAQRAEVLKEDNANLRSEANRIKSEYEQLLAENTSLKERLKEIPGHEDLNSSRNDQDTNNDKQTEHVQGSQ